jgi:hypothetical protein
MTRIRFQADADLRQAEATYPTPKLQSEQSQPGQPYGSQTPLL